MKTILGVLFLLVSLNSASAQLWLAVADPGAPLLGPQHALGAVVWAHGAQLDYDGSLSPSPPYLRTLRTGGWDTFRYNRRTGSDAFEDSSVGLVRQVANLKRRGYRRIVLAGQSFGGWLAVMVAGMSADVDAIVVTSPAAFGTYTPLNPASWLRNATELYPLLQAVRRARVMIFYFAGDELDPGGRGPLSRDILSILQVPNLVVDRPKLGVATDHFTAGTTLFDRAYGKCILRFISTPTLGQELGCEKGEFVSK